jgi:flavodoxin
MPISKSILVSHAVLFLIERISMNILIIYDSMYGNTEQIAKAISESLGTQGNVTLARAGDVKPEQFTGLDLLIVGSPTQRFNATLPISNLLAGMPQKGLQGVKVAAFDTRLTPRQIGETPILAFFVRLFGQKAYAARHIADHLKKKGGELITPPQGYYVEGMEGPLVPGELERAAEWAKRIGNL